MSIHVLKFNPPVCVQRYNTMKDIMKKYKPKKVLDMGCGECSLLRELKHFQGLEQLTGVDVDGDLLHANKHHAKPLMYDHLQPRSHPFTVTLYEGSISQKDARMLGYDLVMCVEIIEHLYADTLANVPEVVFGYMRPKVVVFTTPNADFNILFPDFTGFRHWDHKFEWSREEFQSWGNQVASDYGYTVTYEGIGAGPPGTEHLGSCTQMAIFTCMLPPQEGSKYDDCSSDTPYKQVCEVLYPHQKVTMTTEEQILKEAVYYLEKIARDVRQPVTEETEDSQDEEGTEGRRTISVSLTSLMKYNSLKTLCPSVDKLREVLATCDSVTISEDGNCAIYSIAEDSLFSDSSSDSDHGGTGSCDIADEDNLTEELSSWHEQEENWDV